jgi:hypothetical protein
LVFNKFTAFIKNFKINLIDFFFFAFVGKNEFCSVEVQVIFLFLVHVHFIDVFHEHLLLADKVGAEFLRIKTNLEKLEFFVRFCNFDVLLVLSSLLKNKLHFFGVTIR